MVRSPWWSSGFGDDGDDNDEYDSDEVGENKDANHQKMWGNDKNGDDIGGDNVI